MVLKAFFVYSPSFVANIGTSTWVSLSVAIRTNRQQQIYANELTSML